MRVQSSATVGRLVSVVAKAFGTVRGKFLLGTMTAPRIELTGLPPQEPLAPLGLNGCVLLLRPG